MSSAVPKKVRVVEVGPRDGLQNELVSLSAAQKIELCNRLSASGVPEVEAAAFVSPKWVPQMATSAEVMAGITRRPGTLYSVLTPNMKGFENAVIARADSVVVFGAASEAFSLRNINCSIEESVERFRPVAEAALAQGMRVRGSISCCLGCPYEGEIGTHQVVEVVKRMIDIGCQEIDIADTIGVGTPARTRALFEKVAKVFPLGQFAGHFHDTYGQALANVLSSLEVGVSSFHASIAGLGGCPYAKGATGNLATEDLLFMLHGMGIETAIDLDSMVETGHWVSELLGRQSASRAGSALWAKTQSAGRQA